MTLLTKQLRIKRKDQDDIVLAKGLDVSTSIVGKTSVLAYVDDGGIKQVVIAKNIGQSLLDGYSELQETIPKKVETLIKALAGPTSLGTGAKKRVALKDLATRVEHLGNASTTIAMPSKKKLSSSLSSFERVAGSLTKAKYKKAESTKGKQLTAVYKAALNDVLKSVNKGKKLNVKTYDFNRLGKVLRLLGELSYAIFLVEGDGTEAAILKVLKPLVKNKEITMSKPLLKWLK